MTAQTKDRNGTPLHLGSAVVCTLTCGLIMEGNVVAMPSPGVVSVQDHESGDSEFWSTDHVDAV